jgi:hypothetical protein
LLRAFLRKTYGFPTCKTPQERRALLLKRFHVLQALGADRVDATWPRRLTPLGRAVTAAPETVCTVEESCKEVGMGMGSKVLRCPKVINLINYELYMLIS